jgi:hypothetical protein
MPAEVFLALALVLTMLTSQRKALARDRDPDTVT